MEEQRESLDNNCDQLHAFYAYLLESPMGWSGAYFKETCVALGYQETVSQKKNQNAR